jgi:hypothetical protein
MQLHVRDDTLTHQSTPQEWETKVFPKFSEQIEKNTKGDIVGNLTSPFSTSTPTDLASYQITLMSRYLLSFNTRSMQKFFKYSGRTLSGIPWIELTGTKQVLSLSNNLGLDRR